MRTTYATRSGVDRALRVGTIVEYGDDGTTIVLEHHVLRVLFNGASSITVNYLAPAAISAMPDLLATRATMEEWLSQVEQGRVLHFAALPIGLRRLCRVTFVARMCAVNYNYTRLGPAGDFVDMPATQFAAVLRSKGTLTDVDLDE